MVESTRLLNEQTLKRLQGSNPCASANMRVLCNGKTLAFQADDRGSIPLTRSITTSNNERLQ